MNWIDVTHGKDWQRASIRTILNLQVLSNVGNF